MAVRRSDAYSTKPTNPAFLTGTTLKRVDFTRDLTNGNTSAGDVIILAQVNLSDRVSRIIADFPSLTGATDNDFGFYKSKDQGVTLTELDKDILVDGTDLSSGSALIDVLDLNTSLDRTKTVGELLSLSEEVSPSEIYLCWTMTADNTASAKVSISVDIASQQKY